LGRELAHGWHDIPAPHVGLSPFVFPGSPVASIRDRADIVDPDGDVQIVAFSPLNQAMEKYDSQQTRRDDEAILNF
jgi:hypothetical protein